MCESGKQCNEGESSGERVDQLRRLLWLLMIWVSVLTLGLGVSITLHIIKLQGSNETAPNPTPTPTPTPNPTTNPNPNTTPKTSPTPTPNTRDIENIHNQLTSYVCFDEKGDLVWTEKNKSEKNSKIKIVDDRNYFVFITVTLQERTPGENYTVTLYKTPDGSSEPEAILVGDITGTQMSTGFMGKGVHLSQNTLLSVSCSPTAKIDVTKTYLGLIRF